MLHSQYLQENNGTTCHHGHLTDCQLALTNTVVASLQQTARIVNQCYVVSLKSLLWSCNSGVLSSWLVSNISLWWPDLVIVDTSGLWNRSWDFRWPRPLGAMIGREQDGFLSQFQSSVIWPSYKVFQNVQFICILSFTISSAKGVIFLQIFVYLRYFLGVLLLLSLMAMVPGLTKFCAMC